MIRFFISFLSLVSFLWPLSATAAPFLPIQSLTTPKGISVWYIEDHTQPIIALSFGFTDAGSSHDPLNKQGLAQMLASTLDEGAGPYDSKSFQEQLDNNAISLSFGASRDTFTGDLKTLSDTSGTAFDLLRLALTTPHLADESIARMKQAHISRLLQSKTDPDWQAARLTNDRLFEGTPYAMNSGGTLSGLRAVTRTDLVSFRKTYLTRKSLRVAAVGDITPATLAATIDRIFGDLPAGQLVTKKADSYPLQNSGKTFLYHQNIPQTILVTAQKAPPRDDPDHAAFTVMNYIWGGGGFGSRLMDSIREQSGLTYGIYTGVTQITHAAYVTIQTSTKNDQAMHLQDLTLKETRTLTAKGVTADELKDAKGYLLGSMAAALTSTDRIAGLLRAQMVQGRPIDDLDRTRAAISAVTPADVQRVAQKWLQPESWTTIMVGNPPATDSVTPIKTLPGIE